jgi:glucose 1-dehydrogenase
MNLTGKKALVTGASGGIGKAIALQLAAQGVIVGIHYHSDVEAANNVLEEVTHTGGKGFLLQADFSNPEEAVHLGENAWKLLDGIDFLINNAGVSYKTHFLDTSVKDIDHFTNINFKSTLLLTQTVARKMVADKTSGSIYTVTSINGIQPGVGLSIYGASKGALETLMKGVALELAPHNIRVNTIAAGAIETGMNQALLQDEEKRKLVEENIPMGRLGQPNEIASVIVNLLNADNYMTGSTIVIDGGWLLKHGFAKPTLYKAKNDSGK